MKRHGLPLSWPMQPQSFEDIQTVCDLAYCREDNCVVVRSLITFDHQLNLVQVKLAMRAPLRLPIMLHSLNSLP